jgi:polyisoprenoid-binding protein YceI
VPARIVHLIDECEFLEGRAMLPIRMLVLSALVTISSALLCGQAAPAPRAIDVEHSTMTIHVFRSGIFSFAGDDHEIQAPMTAGSVDESKRAVELTVDAKKLKVLDPKLSADKRSQVQEKMLSPEVLDPERYPEIRFRSTEVQQKGTDGFAVTGNLTLHGQTRPVLVNVTGKAPHYRGKATLKQTNFGMKPVTVGGGTVKVKDEVEIEFDIVTQ